MVIPCYLSLHIKKKQIIIYTLSKKIKNILINNTKCKQNGYSPKKLKTRKTQTQIESTQIESTQIESKQINKEKFIMFAHKLYKQFMEDDTKDDVRERERQERLLAVVKDNTNKIDHNKENIEVNKQLIFTVKAKVQEHDKKIDHLLKCNTATSGMVKLLINELDDGKEAKEKAEAGEETAEDDQEKEAEDEAEEEESVKEDKVAKKKAEDEVEETETVEEVKVAKKKAVAEKAVVVSENTGWFGGWNWNLYGKAGKRNGAY